MAAADRPRPDLPEGTDTLPELRHVVVLMMENHSFDNYLGTLGRGDGFRLGPDGRPDASNPDVDGRPVRAHHLERTVQERWAPTQNWHACHLQRNDGKLDGFPRSVSETVPRPANPDVSMGYWTETDLPFYASLARTFPLADRWFSSCLGPTFPNRRFLIAGTAHGLIDDRAIALVDYPEAGTIFDLLSDHGISWANYHDVSRGRMFRRRALGHRGLVTARYLTLATFRWVPPLVRALRKNLQFTADVYPLNLAGAWSHLRSLEQFFSDAEAGDLPAVSIVDPNFSTFSEENPQDIQIGEGFAAAVI
ncbi:MAG: hypothetical protein J2P58_05300, partial [Acidimicrobiaceae bacterium]|nr:hypothetical protein [Acidimicrobiaceae bacterium]